MVRVSGKRGPREKHTQIVHKVCTKCRWHYPKTGLITRLNLSSFPVKVLFGQNPRLGKSLLTVSSAANFFLLLACASGGVESEGLHKNVT